MNIEFEHIANHSSAEVDSIIDAMVHTKKESARRFINVMNSIVDYYIGRESEEDDICFPIIYLPHAPEWAREVWLKFLILKLSLYYNADNRESLKNRAVSMRSVVLRTKEDEKYLKQYAAPCAKYIRGTLNNITDNYIGEQGHKNMIVCGEGDLQVSKVDKHKFISEFYGTPDDVFTEKNLIMCQNIDVDEIRGQLKEHKREDEYVKVDNLFVFYTNNDKINSFESTYLERWNTAYDMGVRNCFVFAFSKKPFHLRHSINKGISFSKRFPMLSEKESYHYPHYITFDEEESNYLFGWTNTYEHIFIPDDQLLFSDVLGSLLDESEYRIQERNRFSLCLSNRLVSLYSEYLHKSFSDYNDEDYQMSLEWQTERANKSVNPIIHNCIIKEKILRSKNREEFGDKIKIAIVLDKSIDLAMRKALTACLQKYSPRLEVCYYDYSALKPINGNNGIKEGRVIILQYRPHYVRESYAKYPNSFDPIPTRKDQFIHDIIQGVAFNDMYEWDKYDYDKYKADLLDSELRRNLFGKPEKPKKPSVRRTKGENEFSDERSTSRAVVYVRGDYEDGSKFSIPETDFVIYETVFGGPHIARLSEIKKNGKLNDIKRIQKLDDVANKLKVFIAEKSEEVDIREKVIRESQYKLGKITEEERDSSIILWKILLAKKIEEEGLDNAYETVMRGLKDVEKIQKPQFKHWADLDSNMMLPLQKICQRRLFEYLGFGLTSPYLSIMRSKKAATKNGTRIFNSMMDQFLQDTLLEKIDADLFDDYKDSDINDLLNLKSVDDLVTLQSLLRNEISLNNVVNIA